MKSEQTFLPSKFDVFFGWMDPLFPHFKDMGMSALQREVLEKKLQLKHFSNNFTVSLQFCACLRQIKFVYSIKTLIACDSFAS